MLDGVIPVQSIPERPGLAEARRIVGRAGGLR